MRSCTQENRFLEPRIRYSQLQVIEKALQQFDGQETRSQNPKRSGPQNGILRTIITSIVESYARPQLQNTNWKQEGQEVNIPGHRSLGRRHKNMKACTSSFSYAIRPYTRMETRNLNGILRLGPPNQSNPSTPVPARAAN